MRLACCLTPAALVLVVLTGCSHKTTATLPPQATAAQTSIQLNPQLSPEADLSRCPPGIDSAATTPLGPAITPGSGTCRASAQNGRLTPDVHCNPGAINPTLTLAVLQDPNFHTGCVRNNLTTEQQKAVTYSWYSITRPSNNTGQTQVCELDHIVPLYIGGADSLDNIWPQCGPNAVTLNNRYFKQKDRVELYLGDQVRAGKMTLTEAQHGIASNWTQYLPAARKHCALAGCTRLAAAAPVE